MKKKQLKVKIDKAIIEATGDPFFVEAGNEYAKHTDKLHKAVMDWWKNHNPNIEDQAGNQLEKAVRLYLKHMKRLGL